MKSQPTVNDVNGSSSSHVLLFAAGLSFAIESLELSMPCRRAGKHNEGHEPMSNGRGIPVQRLVSSAYLHPKSGANSQSFSER